MYYCVSTQYLLMMRTLFQGNHRSALIASPCSVLQTWLLSLALFSSLGSIFISSASCWPRHITTTKSVTNSEQLKRPWYHETTHRREH